MGKCCGSSVRSNTKWKSLPLARGGSGHKNAERRGKANLPSALKSSHLGVDGNELRPLHRTRYRRALQSRLLESVLRGRLRFLSEAAGLLLSGPW